jgi:hypothetical protein
MSAVSAVHYFRSAAGHLHGFTDDHSGAKLPQEQGPWRFMRTVAPDEGWTAAAEIDAVRAGIRANGFFLADAPGELTFDEPAVKPGD